MKWRDFGKLETSDKLLEYMKSRQYTHGQYCHYTSLDTIEKILESKTLRLSSVKAFNDRKEYENFNNQDNYFSICFATGVNENLPMWYMYSGLDGRGGRIRFTKSQIKQLLDDAKYSLMEVNEDNTVNFIGDLTINESLEIQFEDVLYYLIKDKVSMKYNTMTNYLISTEEFNKYLHLKRPFTKSIIWYYEKESRIVAEVIGEMRKQINPKRKYCLDMRISDKVMNKFHIDLAPELKEDELKNIVGSHPTLYKYMINTSNLALSEYSGTIEMNLCNKCNKK